jgi:hypothetical protein
MKAEISLFGPELSENLFEKIAEKKEDRTPFSHDLTKEERRIKYGMKKFKWKAMGIRGQSVRTLDEMAKLLYDTRAVSSIEEGKEIITTMSTKETE